MTNLIQQIIDNPLPSLAIIGNLVIIESLLSVDNAAVLATMVMDLPEKDRKKALRYGIWGAYLFRGFAMAFAAVLITIWWLKPVGGLYLLWLVVGHFQDKIGYGEKGTSVFKILSIGVLLYLIQPDPGMNTVPLWIFRGLAGIYALYLAYTLTKKSDGAEEAEMKKEDNAVFKFFNDKIGAFWSTIILVEIMDMAFSIDNVFAAVAFTPNIILVCIGVFIGILAMRFVAQTFVKLMEKFHFLETAAFIVIAVLGIKLVLSLYEHFNEEAPLAKFLGSHTADITTSCLTVGIFVLPLLTSLLFNVPKKTKAAEEESH